MLINKFLPHFIYLNFYSCKQVVIFQYKTLCEETFIDSKDWTINNRIIEAIKRSSHQKCSIKKVFLENLQNSQENTCARVSFLIKLQAVRLLLY